MKKITAFACILALCAACAPKTITVKFDPEIQDYTPVVRNILAENPKGGFTLTFEQGTYNFFPEAADGELVYVSNNDSGVKKIVFNFKGMKDITLDGGSSEFIFHGMLVPVSAALCERVTLKNFFVDYDIPFTFEGTILSNDPAARSFTMKVDPANMGHYDIVDGHLTYGGYDWSTKLGENIIFDPQTRRPYFHTASYQHWTKHDPVVREIGEGVLEFSNIHSREIPPVGGVWVDKGFNTFNRNVPAIILSDSKDIKIDAVHIYHCQAMALIAQYCDNITVTNYSTAAREGSTRMITSAADATHFVDCSGDILMDGCRFESMLDDATNVHGIYMKLTRKISDHKFAADFGHYQQYGNHFADKGDRIQFVDKSNLQPVGEGVIKSIDKVNADWYEFETDFDLSSYPDKPNLAIKNLDRATANVTVRNSVVRINRARSLLISCSGKVLIENNDFSSMMAGIHISGDANYWFESGDTQDITIRNNRFTDLGIDGGSPQGALQIVPVVPVAGRTNEFFYHKRIVFEGNEVRTFDRQLVYALSVEELIIKDNKFIDSKSYAPMYDGLSVIDAQYCGKVVIEGNDFSQWQDDATLSFHNCVETQVSDCEYEVKDSPNPFFFGS